MAKISEDKIRERAHQLWQEAGEPKEGERDFWLRAEKELTNKGKEPPAEASRDQSKNNKHPFNRD